MEKLKFLDFCSGIGGGRLGLEQNGMVCIGHSEIDTDADNTYKTFFGADEKNYGDLMQIETAKLPDFDLMIGGFPCQTFSSVGKKAGFDDERGQVVFGLMRILKEKNVPYFILENVKGFVTHDGGKSMKIVLAKFDELGYAVYWKVLNSLDYGVPQSRERIYLIGIRKDIRHKPIEWEKQKRNTLTLKECFNRLHDEPISIYNKSWQNYINSDLNKGRFNEKDLLNEDYLIIDRRNRDMRIYRGRIPTLRKGNHGLFYVHQKQLYKVNGYQSLLFQGFSKDFVLKSKKAKINPNKLLAQAGNAMTVSVVDYVARALLKSIE